MELMLVVTAICRASMCIIPLTQDAPMPDMETCGKVAAYYNQVRPNPGIEWVCAYQPNRSYK